MKKLKRFNRSYDLLLIKHVNGMQANKIDWISQLEINIYTTRLASIDQYFHDTVPLLVGPLHPTSDIFIVIYIFVYVLTCTTG